MPVLNQKVDEMEKGQKNYMVQVCPGGPCGNNFVAVTHVYKVMNTKLYGFQISVKRKIGQNVLFLEIVRLVFGKPVYSKHQARQVVQIPVQTCRFFFGDELKSGALGACWQEYLKWKNAQG